MRVEECLQHGEKPGRELRGTWERIELEGACFGLTWAIMGGIPREGSGLSGVAWGEFGHVNDLPLVRVGAAVVPECRTGVGKASLAGAGGGTWRRVEPSEHLW